MTTKILLFSGLLFALIKSEAQTTFTDYDGNVYNTVTIGTQVWIKENLKVTHYGNGEEIPNVTDQGVWDTLTTGAYCNYNNDISNMNTYGRLYNWHAVVDSRNIAPIGWHVPTYNDFILLFDYLGGTNLAGNKLRETGNIHWTANNGGDHNKYATNSSGFTALPGGFRIVSETFEYMNDFGMWWSSSESSPYAYQLYLTISSLSFDSYKKEMGCSVRLVRDAPASFIFVSIDTFGINASANSNLTFNLSSNTSWDINCDQEWLNINNTSGSNDAIITFSVMENISTSPRTAIITVSGNEVISQYIIVNQDASQASLSVSTNKINLEAIANSQSSFDINSNVSWEIGKDESWLEIDKQSGSNNATITITATANPYNTSRTAILTVSGNNVTTKFIAVTQEATITDINESIDQKIELFPSPVYNKLNISFPNQMSEANVIIFNSDGVKLFEMVLTQKDFEIDMGKYSSGIYFLQIVSKENLLIQKIIKQ
jgi:uncharacterized protein (TIGR02145 family)